MPTNVQNLAAAIANVDQQIADMTASPKPDYSIDGKSVSWGSHYSNLLSLRAQLVEAQMQAEGPYEYHLRGTS